MFTFNSQIRPALTPSSMHPFPLPINKIFTFPVADECEFGNISSSNSSSIEESSDWISLHNAHLWPKSLNNYETFGDQTAGKHAQLLINQKMEMKKISSPITSDIPKMGRMQTIFTIVNVYVNNTMLFNPYVC